MTANQTEVNLTKQTYAAMRKTNNAGFTINLAKRKLVLGRSTDLLTKHYGGNPIPQRKVGRFA